jgi:hypothetical protein
MYLNLKKGGTLSLKNGAHVHRGSDQLKLHRHNKQDTNLERLKDSLEQMKISSPQTTTAVRGGKKQYVYF